MQYQHQNAAPAFGLSVQGFEKILLGLRLLRGSWAFGGFGLSGLRFGISLRGSRSIRVTTNNNIDDNNSKREKVPCIVIQRILGIAMTTLTPIALASHHTKSN